MTKNRYSNDPHSEEDRHFFDKYSSTGDGQFSITESYPLDSDVSSERHFDENFVGVGPKNYRRSDGTIYEEICEVLMQTPEIDATEIDVMVQDGDVTLRGSVQDREARRLAEDLIEHVPGVHDVFNQLRPRFKGTAKNQQRPLLHNYEDWV